METHGDQQIVALCGSQRNGSHTRTALRVALEAAADRGASTELLRLETLDLPVFDPDHPDVGDASILRETVRDADGVVLGSPMYHGSYSSTLKTALDYCGFEEFDATTVGLLVVSGGGFPTPALEHLRSVARALDVWVLPHQVGIPNADTAFEEGSLVDADLQERVERLGTELVDYTGVESYPEAKVPASPLNAD